MKILKLSALLALFSSAINAETPTDRAAENRRTHAILAGTPVSILSYGISRLDEKFSDLASKKLYYDNFKQDGETGLLHAFLSKQWIGDEISPVIMIQSTIFKFGGRSDRSKSSAEALCQRLLDHTAETASIYIDEDNDFFTGLWNNSEFFTDYRNNVDIDSIRNMIYLKARVEHSGSDDPISCRRPY